MKVFVTGSGVLSSLGNSVDEMFSGLVEGRTGVRLMEGWENYRGLKSRVGAPVAPYDHTHLPRTARRSMSRMSEMATLATLQALEEAGLKAESISSPRVLIILGSTSGSPDTLEAYFKKLFDNKGPEGQVSTSFFKVMNHSVAANVASALNFRGALMAPSCACATSTQAVVMGSEMIRAGLYDVVIAGGADELHYISTSVFDIVFAASAGYNDKPDLTPRPFDIKRDGLVVSEGAGVVILESEEHMKKRSAKPLMEILGGSYWCDGSHMSQSSHSAMVEVMRATLEKSKVKPSEIGYVNAHATGTLQGDGEEAKAIASVFGSETPTSSLKGHMGHSLAACGVQEIIACMKMMKTETLIPTRNLTEVAPDCADAQHLMKIMPRKVDKMLTNNFAFGGMNVSLVLAKS